MIIKKKNNVIALIAILAGLMFVFLWWSEHGGNLGSGQVVQSNPQFQSVSDLDNATKQLDGTDLNQIDSGMNQVASDSSTF